MCPIFSVGLSALIAYCGMTEISLEAMLVHRLEVPDRKLACRRAATEPTMYFMRPVR